MMMMMMMIMMIIIIMNYFTTGTIDLAQYMVCTTNLEGIKE